jgi:penicillin-insensitive murein DD-endopeptidase
MAISRHVLILCLAIGGCSGSAGSVESVCYGTPENGSLENGVSLPLSGPNFSSYSSLGWQLGRAHVHSKVSTVLLEAFSSLEASAPGKVFVYGEMGWASGGRIRPHKTHRNGLSVDLMVPVLRSGKSVPLPASPWNRFGYDLEFNNDGVLGEYQIDWEALGLWLRELHASSKRNGVPIRRVIFEVPLQQHLFRSSHGTYLKNNITFSTKQAWVRHDEHFHIDFSVPCRPAKEG